MKPLNYDIAAIENATLALLLPMKTAGHVRTLESYGGQLDVDDLGKLTLLFPAVYVIWSGVQIRTYNQYEGLTSGITIIACTQNLRGTASARSGDPAPYGTPYGAYDLLGEVRACLHGKIIDREFYPAMLVREAPLAYLPSRSLAVYEALYELRRRT